MSKALAAAVALGATLLLLAPGSVLAGTVQIHWPSPPSADVLRSPVSVEVLDARGWMVQRSVGGGLKPGFDAREHPYDAPPKEDWTLSAPDSFPSGLRQSVELALRAEGVWASFTMRVQEARSEEADLSPCTCDSVQLLDANWSGRILEEIDRDGR